MKISKQFLIPLSILMISSIGLTSCGGGTKPASSLEGTHWQLSSVNWRVLRNKLSKRMTINFNSKRATGSSGCNRYFANYTLSAKNAVHFSAIGSTKMLCKPRFMKIERKFLEALRGASSYRISSGELMIEGSGATLKFRKP
ncbi:MAG TPA: META domain-containing protein [Leucothrix mucor]|nr:META domain-containing protein [Leucothrix mucor]